MSVKGASNCSVLPPTTAADGDKTEDEDDDDDDDDDDDATAGRPPDTERSSFRDSAPRFGFRGFTGGRGFVPILFVDTKQ